MKGLIIVILGIFIFEILGLGLVFAEENCTDTCSILNYTCGTQTVCNSSINCGNCSEDKICLTGKCVINETEVNEDSGCTNITNRALCEAKKNCEYNNVTGKCVRETKIKKLKESLQAYLNSTECPEKCTCAGSTIKCETENGRVMTVVAGKSGNVIIITQTANASTSVVLIKNSTGLYGTFSGKIKKIKYLPDEIKERVLKKLKLENSSSYNITLQEDGNYVMNIDGKYRVLWIFPIKTIVVMKINSEIGDVVIIKKPWWKFRAD